MAASTCKTETDLNVLPRIEKMKLGGLADARALVAQRMS